jgi:hypothetical protein
MEEGRLKKLFWTGKVLRWNAVSNGWSGSPAVQQENNLNELHQEQLERYRQALQHLTGLPPGKICMTLLFTSLPKAVT